MPRARAAASDPYGLPSGAAFITPNVPGPYAAGRPGARVSRAARADPAATTHPDPAASVLALA